MRSGNLRHWVTFERPVTVQDSDGNDEVEWVDAFQINSRMPCEVTDLSGNALFAAQAAQSKVTTRIKVRYRPGFDASMRGRLGRTIYNIEAVIADPESRIRWTTLLCVSGTDEG